MSEEIGGALDVFNEKQRAQSINFLSVIGNWYLRNHEKNRLFDSISEVQFDV
jgi:hypothetical protein